MPAWQKVDWVDYTMYIATSNYQQSREVLYHHTASPNPQANAILVLSLYSHISMTLCIYMKAKPHSTSVDAQECTYFAHAYIATLLTSSHMHLPLCCAIGRMQTVTK